MRALPRASFSRVREKVPKADEGSLAWRSPGSSVGHGVNMQPPRQLEAQAMQDQLAVLIGG